MVFIYTITNLQHPIATVLPPQHIAFHNVLQAPISQPSLLPNHAFHANIHADHAMVVILINAYSA